MGCLSAVHNGGNDVQLPLKLTMLGSPLNQVDLRYDDRQPWSFNRFSALEDLFRLLFRILT